MELRSQEVRTLAPENDPLKMGNSGFINAPKFMGGSPFLCFCQRARPLRRSRARFPLLSPTVTSSPGAGEVFPQRESQAVKPVAKVLGIMRKLLGVLLALPLGELSPKVTERASPPYGLFAPFTTFQ